MKHKCYIDKILQKQGLLKSNVVWTPLPQIQDKSSAQPSEKLWSKSKHARHWRTRRVLMCLAARTRPDIALGENMLARQIHSSTLRYALLLSRLFRQFSGTETLNIVHNSSKRNSSFQNKNSLVVFVYSEWVTVGSTRTKIDKRYLWLPLCQLVCSATRSFTLGWG